MNFKDKISYEERIALLEERVAYVEKINRQCLESLDIAGRLGYFQSSLNRLPSPIIILQQAEEKIRSQIEFEKTAFFLVDERTSEFFLAHCNQQDDQLFFDTEFQALADHGILAWVIREKRGIIMSAQSVPAKLFLHVITTSSRIRGFFIGVIPPDFSEVPYVSQKLASIVLLFCANALESFELYSMVRNANRSLKERIRGRTIELQYKTTFEHLVKQISDEFLKKNTPICHRVRICLGMLQKFFSADRCILFYTTDAMSQFMTRALNQSSDQTINDFIKPISPVRLNRIWESRQQRGVSFLHKQESDIAEISLILNLPGFNSTLLVPVEFTSDFRGFLFLGLAHDLQNWSEDTETMLRIASEFFLNALLREKMVFELEQQQEQLHYAQKMDAIGRLASGISHDFNNILMSISVNAELALMQNNPSMTNEQFRQILKASEKGSFITRQLLAMSKRRQEAKQPFPIKKLIKEISKVLDRLLGDDIELEIELPEDEDGSILSSPGQLEQVIMNLVVNARDAIREKGNQAKTGPSPNRIALKMGIIEPDSPGRHALFEVRDTGCGMSPEVRKQVFEPFFTTKESSKGTGLGLSIVYQILRDNKGSIQIESEEGKGTKVSVHWPLFEDYKVSLPESKSYGPLGDDRLLIVEDDASIRSAVSRSLESLGYTVYQAHHGKDALAQLAEQPVDFVISDINMPEMNGLELVDHIEHEFPKVRVILSTGFFDGVDHAELEKKNIPVIEKPYSVMNISKTIHCLKSKSSDKS